MADSKIASIMTELFGKDFCFSLATCKDGIPSVRVVDTYFDGSAFWVVTHASLKKVGEIEGNPYVALCNGFHTFKGQARNMGHPLQAKNTAIRETLIKEFKPWYFAHNNEGDERMCYIRIEPTSGFFHKDGIGYSVNFISGEVEEIPFNPQ